MTKKMRRQDPVVLAEQVSTTSPSIVTRVTSSKGTGVASLHWEWGILMFCRGIVVTSSIWTGLMSPIETGVTSSIRTGVASSIGNGVMSSIGIG